MAIKKITETPVGVDGEYIKVINVDFNSDPENKISIMVQFEVYLNEVTRRAGKDL